MYQGQKQNEGHLSDGLLKVSKKATEESVAKKSQCCLRWLWVNTTTNFVAQRNARWIIKKFIAEKSVMRMPIKCEA